VDPALLLRVARPVRDVCRLAGVGAAHRLADLAPREGWSAVSRGLGKSTLTLIDAAGEILEAIQPTTVRSVAYKLFALGLIPNMGKNAVATVSRALTTAREAGAIPWAWIVDENRAPEYANTWDNADQRIDYAVRNYRRDYWQEQALRLEVWSEKGTVRGVLAPTLDEYGVTFRSMSGFASATVVYSIAEHSIADYRPMLALYVGDHDPSGRYMSDIDLPVRMARYGGAVEIVRVALTESDLVDLPSFDAATKKADARYRWFVERFGSRCHELDAMDPNDLRARIVQQIRSRLNLPAWERAIEVERAEVDSMRAFHAEWKRRTSEAAT